LGSLVFRNSFNVLNVFGALYGYSLAFQFNFDQLLGLENGKGTEYKYNEEK
jgi:hypothetical protein